MVGHIGESEGFDDGQRERLATSAPITTILAYPPLDPTRTAVVVVDMVNHQLTRGRGMLRPIEEAGVGLQYYLDRVYGTVIPNLQQLIAAFRQRDAKIVHVRTGGYRDDFSDGV